MESQSNSHYQIDRSTIEFVKQWEGWAARPYRDAAGNLTIGFGHLLAPNEHPVYPISEDQGNALLQSDLSKAGGIVSNAVTVPLNQNQFSALISLVFNIGANAFLSSTLLKSLNSGAYRSAANQFTLWNKAVIDGKLQPVAGLTRRREAERELFLRSAPA